MTALPEDFKRSTELMAELDTEEALAIVDPALLLLIDTVRRYGGYVRAIDGDRIFALWCRDSLGVLIDEVVPRRIPNAFPHLPAYESLARTTA